MKKNFLDISLIMAVHYEIELNSLEKSIKSIFNQLYIPKEIILIIDGIIKEKLNDAINEYVAFYGNIKVFRIKNNSGLASALNYGISKANSNFISRLDPEDEVINERFKIQLDEFHSNDNLSICGSYIFEYFNNKKKIIRKPIHNHEIYNSLKFKNPLIHSTIMFKKDKILDIGGYPNIDKCQDYLLWIKAMEKMLVFKNIDKPLVNTNLNLSMMERRSFNYFKYEFYIYKYMLMKKIITLHFFITISFLRLLIRIIPNIIKINLYKFR
jgi:glycosyltransferase involved in cell wall biosynthesis